MSREAEAADEALYDDDDDDDDDDDNSDLLRVYEAVDEGCSADDLRQVIKQVARGSDERRLAAVNAVVGRRAAVKFNESSRRFIDEDDTADETPLAAARRSNRADLIGVLLEAGAEVRGEFGADGPSTLAALLAFGSIQNARALLSSGDPIVKQAVRSSFSNHGVPCSLTLNDEPNAFTLAHFCIRPSSLLSGRLVDSVIASGPFYVAPSRDYDPFLAKTHKPPPAPRLDLLELLVRTGGADVKARDTYDETPLIWLGRAGGDDLERALDLLLELGADVRVRSQTNVDTYSRGDDGTRRREATRAPDVMPLQALLENEFGASVEVRIACARKLIAAGAPTSGIYDAYGNNLLTSAAMQYKKNGALRLIKFLLEEVGLDVNERSPITGGTALCSAIWPEEDVIHALLDAGADIKATDNNGRTALHACCDEDNIKVGALQFLLERGAPAGGRDHNGLTVLMHVCCNYDALQRQREDKTQYWAVMDELWRRSSDETRRAVSPDEHASNDKGSSAVDFLVESWTNARFMWSVGDDHDPYLDDKLKEMVVTMLLAGVPMLPEHAEDVLPMVVSHGVPRIGRAKSELRELRSEKRRWMAHDDVVQLALDVVEVREVDEVVRRRERRVAELEEELRRRGIGSEEEDDDDEGTAAASQERP